MGRLAVALVFFSLLVALRAEAGGQLDCHVYRANESDPKVQGEFGPVFRKGYEVVTICRSERNHIEYFALLPLKKRASDVCSWMETRFTIDDFDVKNRGRFSKAPAQAALDGPDLRQATVSEGACPKGGGDSYIPTDAPDEAFAAIWTYWKALKAGDVDREFLSVPVEAKTKSEFVGEVKRALSDNRLDLTEITLDNHDSDVGGAAPGRKAAFVAKVRTTYAHSEISTGWAVGGEVREGRFVPEDIRRFAE